MPDGPIYFLSDAHLGQEDASGEARKLRALEGFLAHLGSDPGPLYLDGDLFEFWFEYRHAVPRGHFRILTALLAARKSGIPMEYIGGNHDFWVGDFLSRELGIGYHDGPVALEAQGRRIWIARELPPAEHEALLRHELVHVRQMEQLGVLAFVVRYLGEYLANRVRRMGHDAAYRAISFEREAFAAERALE